MIVAVSSDHLHPLGEVIRCTLQESADSHNDRSDENGSLAAERVADEDGEHRANETS